MRRQSAVLLVSIGLILAPGMSFGAENIRIAVSTPVGGFSPAPTRVPQSGVRLAFTCSSRDGSRVCHCEKKCHVEDDDCDCEDD
jgi:hypothetical protein